MHDITHLHDTTTLNLSFRCEHCNKIFTSSNTLTSHKLSHMSSDSSDPEYERMTREEVRICKIPHPDTRYNSLYLDTTTCLLQFQGDQPVDTGRVDAKGKRITIPRRDVADTNERFDVSCIAGV